MELFKIWNDRPAEKQIKEIVELLKNGDIGLIPTDTLYAICCDAFNARSVERICKIKGINPEKTNLSIICADISMASDYARIDNSAFRLLKNLTPCPVTFLFKTTPNIPRIFRGRKIIGIRIPDSNIDREIVSQLGHPIMTTSIVYDEDDYAINPELIAENYSGMVNFMVDGGDASTEPSTIIDFSEGSPVLIRKGKFEIDEEDL